MSHVTVGQVLAEVDALTPNPYTTARKRHWLQQAEAFVALAVGAKLPEGPLEDGQQLLAEVPYDGLYGRYVEAQIHYAAGEIGRYNNAMAVWNQLLLAWQAQYHRGSGRAAALKLC